MSRHALFALDARTMHPAVYALLALLAHELPASAEQAAVRVSRHVVWC